MRTCLLIIAVWLLGAGSAEARRHEFSGASLPDRLFIGSNFIIEHSDSVWINGTVIDRTAYSFNNTIGAFELGRLTVAGEDTVVVVYRPMPRWLQRSYGVDIPSVESTTRRRPDEASQDRDRTGQVQPGAFSDISLTGSKAFRFNSTTGGGSDFNQALDLRISGHLTESVEISGAVTDRGYDPTYGTSNSRLSELERVNLQLRSPSVIAQIGDISIASPLSQAGRHERRVSGATVHVRQRQWSVNGLAARPKGRFARVQFVGRDGVQGPYRVAQGTQVTAIVPGSEEVWLDGRQLQRGGDKDYIMDYPTGRITFNVNHPIDRRSRIEIDYETAADEYREELFAGGAGVASGDSSLIVQVEWLREGDDRSELVAGELSDVDRGLLGAAGDDPMAAVRSGIGIDSLGSYDLVSDSLPDSVFVFVGRGNGAYSVQFSFVGAGQGSYRFRGDNNYTFAGVGAGDYAPIVFVPLPERSEFVTTRAAYRHDALGRLTAEWRHSRFDRNLWSAMDDDDNSGNFVRADYRRDWLSNGRPGHVSYNFHLLDRRFNEPQRFNRADFRRDFLLPDTSRLDADEQWHQAEAQLPVASLAARPRFGFVQYPGRFRALRFGGGLRTAGYEGLDVSIDVDATEAELTSESAGGRSATASSNVAYRIARPLTLLAGAAYDHRTNHYTGSKTGARFLQWTSGVDVFGNRLTFERFVQDTLTAAWSEELDRNRFAASGDRRFGNLNIQTILTYQWLTRENADESSFLSRLNLQYDDLARRLNASASYVLSEESRNARGIAYIEVDPGQGQFIEEDGRFIPDPDGNFIQVEEILSDESLVRRGEKGFSFSRYGSMAAVRFNSTIEEELKPEGERDLLWLLPFYSSDDQPYQFQVRRYDAELRLLRTGRFWAINLSYGSDRELREVAGTPRLKDDVRYTVQLKQAAGAFFFEEGVERFESDRDAYFNGGGIVDGVVLNVRAGRRIAQGEVSLRGNVRRADAATGLRSDIISGELAGRLRLFGRGELRSSLELYAQDLTGPGGFVPYLLTENRSGRRGAIWSLDFRRDLRDYLRARLRISGRHADDRTARITARGEVVAQF